MDSSTSQKHEFMRREASRSLWAACVPSVLLVATQNIHKRPKLSIWLRHGDRPKFPSPEDAFWAQCQATPKKDHDWYDQQDMNWLDEK